MFNSSGSMYEEIEANRQKKLRKKKIMTRRITVIVVLLVLLAYLGILLNDIRRLHNGELPLIVLSSSTKEYDDGRVESYNSLGWVFRYYFRETINTHEIVPFWAPITMDNVLNREVYDPDLPEVEKDYKVPNNGEKRRKIGSVLFFYDKDQKLLGTYKCILSESDCDITNSAYLEMDKRKRPSDVEMAIIDNRYVFIEEYKSKGTSVEERVVYLYDIYAKHLLAHYDDVRYTILLDEEIKGQAFGTIDQTKYMAKRDGYWGIDDVNKGKVTNFVNYEYKGVKYDEESQLYVFLTKQNKWVVFNPVTKTFTTPIDKTIESIHYKNSKPYIVAYELDDYSNKNYYLLDEDGNNLLFKENVDDLTAYDNFLIYGKENNIYIVNYDGKEATSSVKLYINLDDAYSYSRVKPYSVQIIDKMLIISTPKTQEKTHFTDMYYYDLETLELIKTRENVKETSY